jgi:hypothetical protein
MLLDVQPSLTMLNQFMTDMVESLFVLIMLGNEASGRGVEWVEDSDCHKLVFAVVTQYAIVFELKQFIIIIIKYLE